MTPDDECDLDTCRFFDAETKRYGYAVICLRDSHGDREHCPGEHEMFRSEPRETSDGV